MGILASTILGYVIISDVYPLAKQQKLIGYLNGAITLSMSIAPVSGSFLTLYYT